MYRDGTVSGRGCLAEECAGRRVGDVVAVAVFAVAVAGRLDMVEFDCGVC